MPRQFTDLTGQRFGRLVVLGQAFRDRHGQHWFCQCDCGNSSTVASHNLTGAHPARSCGCWRRLVLKRGQDRVVHGQARAHKPSPEWEAWHTMRQRCLNPKWAGYRYWGGRGITVCDRWLGPEGFANFLADMGRRPAGIVRKRARYSLDRINNDGNYEPGNCRWATINEQLANRRPYSRRH